MNKKPESRMTLASLEEFAAGLERDQRVPYVGNPIAGPGGGASLVESMTKRFVVYEDPDTSEVAEEFDKLADALKWRAKPGARIVRNGVPMATVIGRRWVLTAAGKNESIVPSDLRAAIAEAAGRSTVTESISQGWYRQSFGDETLYFRASGERLKNGNATGTQVTVDLDRPRAKPKAKAISVNKTNEGLWKSVPESDVPEAVRAAV